MSSGVERILARTLLRSLRNTERQLAAEQRPLFYEHVGRFLQNHQRAMGCSSAELTPSEMLRLTSSESGGEALDVGFAALRELAQLELVLVDHRRLLMVGKRTDPLAIEAGMGVVAELLGWAQSSSEAAANEFDAIAMEVRERLAAQEASGSAGSLETAPRLRVVS